MKSIKVMILAGGLAVMVVVTVAFIDMRHRKTIEKIQNTKNSAGFAVVELFTSEGCSSCPPADELMEKIQAGNKNKQIYILSFHVDYWDRQGWKDRFSNPDYSNRQYQYRNWFRLQVQYTPQVVINGKTQHVGTDQGAILKAISTNLLQKNDQTLKIDSHIDHRMLDIQLEAKLLEKNTELVLALVQKVAHSDIKAGENTGRKLSHVQIVRKLLSLPLENYNKRPIKMELPNDFSQHDWELVGFVQREFNGEIIAANRISLPATLASSER
ncbi:MAG TPA: DUF1223 domain-containing protein [Pseudosphingobacterium sp.]|nr:DUF1223 domain-containing protein [Pseudosphingobacterium sp.]